MTKRSLLRPIGSRRSPLLPPASTARRPPRTSLLAASTRGDTSRGQSVVEFALVIPIFLTIMVAIVEFALVFNAQLALNFATREAALAAAEAGNDADADCSILRAVEASIDRPRGHQPDHRGGHLPLGYGRQSVPRRRTGAERLQPGRRRWPARRTANPAATVGFNLVGNTRLPGRGPLQRPRRLRWRTTARSRRRQGDLRLQLAHAAGVVHWARRARATRWSSRTRCGWSRSCEPARPRRRIRASSADAQPAARALVEFALVSPALPRPPARDARVRVRLQPPSRPRVRHPRGRPDGRGPRFSGTDPDRRAPTSTRTSSRPSSGSSRRPARRSSPAGISEIRIFRADANGAQIGNLVNTWVPGTGPDGRRRRPEVHAVAPVELGRLRPANSWTLPNTPPDSIGVSLTYSYDLMTPLGKFVPAFGVGRRSR